MGKTEDKRDGSGKKWSRRSRYLFAVLPVAAVLVIACGVYLLQRGAGKKDRIIFVGDSRTVAMYMAVTDDYSTEDVCTTGSDGNLWSAKSGMGLAWMEETGVPRIADKIGEGDQLVIAMGVNDIAGGPDEEAYLAYLKKEVPVWLEKGAAVYYVSVNPIRKALSNGLTQERIDAWNARMREGLPASISYIDTASVIKDTATYADDLHYQNDTNRAVYTAITEEVAAHSSQTSGGQKD